MAYKLEFHPEAEAELEEALMWYLQESPADPEAVLSNLTLHTKREAAGAKLCFVTYYSHRLCQHTTNKS